MTRYIENLNECTDPASGDYMWLVDASAGSTDKDRKVDVGKFARLAVNTTFAGSVTAAQVVVDGGSIDVDAASAFYMSGIPQALADNAVLSLPSYTGVLLITDVTNGNVAMFALRGGVNATQEIYDPSSIFTTTKDTASSFNVYYDAGYKIQNKRGGSRTIVLFRFGY